MMHEPVDDCQGHGGIVENLRPIGEGEIGGDRQRGVFIELADLATRHLPCAVVDQPLAAGLAERQIAGFVDDDEIEAQEFFAEPAAPSGRLFLLQLIDRIDGIEEAPPGAGAHDRRGHGDAQMGFARAVFVKSLAADEYRVAPGVEEGARGGFAHEACIDGRAGKDKPCRYP